jgi:hypothetical protein
LYKHASSPPTSLDPRLPEGHWDDLLDAWYPPQGFSVVDGQLVGGATERPWDTESFDLARVNGNDAGSELREVGNDVVPRSLTERGQEDHRGHPNGDPKRRKERTQLLAAQGATNKAEKLD